MGFEVGYDPFGYPLYVERWVLLPGGRIELLRVEKVRCPDGTVRYYHPGRPSFLEREPREFGPEEVADSRAELEERRGKRRGSGPAEEHGWPKDV